ncbi:MAG TPA: hypothetical protein VMR18_02975 [Candidatus Saccharimonadales bacterium]|nr:hypothetical protein [Candidatus Saccharimonadales bacterium]
MNMSDSEYQYPQEDIESMLRYLRLNLPAHATPEKAIFLLEQNKVHIESLEELHPEVIEEMLKDFEEH